MVVPMRGSVTLLPSGWRLVPAGEVGADDRMARVDPSFAGSKIDEWCVDATVWPKLYDLYKMMSGESLRPPTSFEIEHAVKPFLRRALERGQLIALAPHHARTSEAKSERGVHIGKPPVPDSPKPTDVPRIIRVIPEKAPAIELSFIEIVLLDDDGTPVAGEMYELVLANGEVRRGALDDQGAARIQDIPAGNCQVRFPDIDGHEWQQAK
jgi:hypothetical protein